MIKKLIFFTLSIAIVFKKNLYSMEQASEEIVIQERINLADWLPDELLVSIVELATDSNAAIEFNELRTACFQFGAQKKFNNSLCSKGQWVSPINLNPAQILCANEKDTKNYLFSVQCWHKNITEFGNDEYSNTEYRIDDDGQKKRFMASASLEIETPFFDGINEDDWFIIAGNSQKEETVFIQEDKVDIAETSEKKSFNLFSWISKKEETPKPLAMKKKVYEYYIGKFRNPLSETLHKNRMYHNRAHNTFDFISSRIMGTLTAIALSKTSNWNPKDPNDNKNRFALADDQGLSIYEIEEPQQSNSHSSNNKTEHHNKISVHQIGFGELFKHNENIINANEKRIMNEDASITKLSFITPKTLLGLTKSGRLLCFALDTEFNTITYQPHYIKNQDGKELFIHNFALNPCKPYQLVVCTRTGHLLYINLKNCLKPQQEKKAKFLIKVKKLPVSMWFYNTTLCLGNYSDKIETENYVLIDDLDLTLKKGT